MSCAKQHGRYPCEGASCRMPIQCLHAREWRVRQAWCDMPAIPERIPRPASPGPSCQPPPGPPHWNGQTTTGLSKSGPAPEKHINGCMGIAVGQAWHNMLTGWAVNPAGARDSWPGSRQRLPRDRQENADRPLSNGGYIRGRRPRSAAGTRKRGSPVQTPTRTALRRVTAPERGCGG